MKRINYNFPQPARKFEFSLISQSSVSLSTINAQGACFDGTYYYFTDSNTIRKYTRSGNLYTSVSSRDCMSDNPIEKTQINEIVFHDGFLWIGANNYITGGTDKKGWILKYDPATLTLVSYYPTENYWNEGGAWKDLGLGDEMFTVYVDWDHVSRYRFVGGVWTHIADYEMSLVKGMPIPTNFYLGLDTGGLYQGCIWYGNYLIATTHCFNPDPQIHIYHWNGGGFDAVEKFSTLNNNIGQGISWEVYGQSVLFASRAQFSVDNRIVRANFIEL